jgi:hypothetical protein
MTRPGLGRLGRFAIAWLVLLAVAAWPFAFVGRGYRLLVGGAVNGLIFHSPTAPSVARLTPDARPDHAWYLKTTVSQRTTGKVEGQFDVDVYQAFYLPTAVFIALTLAGRLTLGGKRAVLKLLLGIVLLQLRGWLRFIALERALSGISYGPVDLLLLLANRSLVAPLAMAFVLPLILWFALFRRSLVPLRDANER